MNNPERDKIILITCSDGNWILINLRMLLQTTANKIIM